MTDYRRAAPRTGSVQNRVSVPFHFGSEQLNSYVAIPAFRYSATAETTASIPTKFCSTIKTEQSSWVAAAHRVEVCYLQIALLSLVSSAWLRDGSGMQHVKTCATFILLIFSSGTSAGERQEAFKKCWAHSSQRAASRQFTRCR